MVAVNGTDTNSSRRSPVARLTMYTFCVLRMFLLRVTMYIRVLLPMTPTTNMMTNNTGTMYASGWSANCGSVRSSAESSDTFVQTLSFVALSITSVVILDASDRNVSYANDDLDLYYMLFFCLSNMLTLLLVLKQDP